MSHVEYSKCFQVILFTIKCSEIIKNVKTQQISYTDGLHLDEENKDANIAVLKVLK
jgi:hypothetical protein